MNSNKIKIGILFAFIMLAGLVLRIYHLAYHDLWFDEAYSAHLIKFPQYIAGDPQAPLHTFLLIGLVKLTGLGEFWLRFPAFVFGFFSIAAIYLLGIILFERKVALMAAFLLAISPLHIWYSQEARGYTQAIFLVILSTYFFVRSIKENRLIFRIGLLLTQLAGCYTNYLFPLILIPQVIILLKYNKKHIRNWFLSWFVTFLFFLPWLNVFISRFQSVVKEFWIPRPNLFSFFITFFNFNLGYTVPSFIYYVSSIPFLVILISGIWRGIKRHRESVRITMSFAFIPIISAFLISQIRSIYISRQMSLYLPFYLLLVSLGILLIKKQILKIGIMIILFYFTGISLANYYKDQMPCPRQYHLGAHIKKPIRPIAKFIKDKYRKDDIIAFSNPQYKMLLEYYLGEDYPYHYFIIPFAQDKYWRDRILARKRSKHVIDLSRVENLPDKKIWLISGDWSRDGKLDKNSRAVKSYLNKLYTQRLDIIIEGTRIALYEKILSR